MNKDNLTDMDLHCIARILQSTVFANGLFTGCDFCKYQCFDSNSEPVKNYRIVMRKLQEITGVDMSPACSHNPYFKIDISKFIKESNPGIKEKLLKLLD